MEFTKEQIEEVEENLACMKARRETDNKRNAEHEKRERELEILRTEHRIKCEPNRKRPYTESEEIYANHGLIKYGSGYY